MKQEQMKNGRRKALKILGSSVVGTAYAGAASGASGNGTTVEITGDGIVVHRSTTTKIQLPEKSSKGYNQ